MRVHTFVESPVILAFRRWRSFSLLRQRRSIGDVSFVRLHKKPLNAGDVQPKPSEKHAMENRLSESLVLLEAQSESARDSGDESPKLESPFRDIWLLMIKGKPLPDGTPVQLGGTLLSGTVGAKFAQSVAPPLMSDMKVLAMKYPGSSWATPLPNYQLEGETLRNLASWDRIGHGNRKYPEAQKLLKETERRALRSAVGSAFCGGAINFALDQTVYKSQPYGPATATFDTFGTLFICGGVVPLRARYAIPAQTAMIVGGHMLCRWLDRAYFEKRSEPVGLGRPSQFSQAIRATMRGVTAGGSMSLSGPSSDRVVGLVRQPEQSWVSGQARHHSADRNCDLQKVAPSRSRSGERNFALP